ncbi:MAG TPA: helix-turn-helix domain-containing protein [Pseudonocardiaceae bacterium]|nr:helix-turn-helix domain-containing protein [Pseudonocardiaceae bacterium]
MMPREAQISAVAALDEPTRRQLYDYVVNQPGPVSRDDAAAALDLPRTTAAFHLDRLVDEKLLDVAYERRTGRTGPGAGRPAKLYRRSDQHVAVSLPQRHYDLAGRLLSGAVEEAERSGESPRAILDQRAYQLGKQLGETARAADGDGNARDTALRVLKGHGFEPRLDDGRIVLANCPFHALTEVATELVCGMNAALVGGVLDGLGRDDLEARLEPAEGRCCVVVSPTGHAGRRRQA